MSIQQVNVRYVHEQDRVLLRLNTNQGEELCVWLTRFILLRLLPELDKMIANMAVRQNPKIAATDELSKKMVAQFQQEEQLKSGDFDSPYRQENLRPLLAGEPLLATSISMGAAADGQLHMCIIEKLAGTERKADLRMNAQLYHGLARLLNQCIDKAHWRSPAPASEAISSVEPARPPYLN